MCMKCCFVLLFFILGISAALPAQNPIGDNIILKDNPVITEAGDVAHLVFKAEQLLLSDLDSAYYFAQYALDESQRNQNSVGSAISYIHLAHIYLRKGEYRTALEYINLAQLINDYLKNSVVEAALYYVKARLFLITGNTNDASKEAMNALSLFETIGDSLNLARVYNFLGGVYSEIGDIDKAIQNNQVALTIQKDLGLKYYNASSYSNIGVCLLNKGELDSAIMLVNTAIVLNNESRNFIWLANNYHLLGLIYRDQSENDSARYYFNESLVTHKNYGSFSGESSILSALGSLDLHEGDLLNANMHFTKAKQLAVDHGLLSHHASALQGLYRIAKYEHKFEEACAFLEQFKSLSDSLEKMQNVSLITMLELEKEVAQNRLLQKFDLEQMALQQRKKNFFIILLVVVIVALAIGIYMILSWHRLRRRKMSVEKEELSREIEYKNKELTLSVMAQVKKNETIQNLVKTLEKGLKGIDILEKRKISSLVKELKKQKDDTVWEEFEMRFKNVYNDFYSKLRNDFPDLSLPEIKICAFLRMGLNTKEIASLLYKSQASIEVDRARIRRKMGLTGTKVNLNSFLTDL